MTCSTSTYANRPRTREDERKTAKLLPVHALPTARSAFHRGLAVRDHLLAQAPNRVRFTVTIIARDAWVFGLAVGLLAGVAIGQWVLR